MEEQDYLVIRENNKIMHPAQSISEYYKRMKKENPERYKKEMGRRDRIFKQETICYGIILLFLFGYWIYKFL